MQQGFAFGAVALDCLLLEEFVNVRIAAVGIGALRIDEGLHAGRGIPRRSSASDKESWELSVLPGGIESSPFHGAHFHPNADGVQVVHHGLPNHIEGRNGRQLTGVEAVRIAGLSQQLPGLFGVVRQRFGLQGKVHDTRNDHRGRRAEAQAGGLVDRLPVEGVVGR